MPPSKVDIGDPAYEVHGVDVIWHNMNVENENAFQTFRHWSQDSIDQLLIRVAGHLQAGHYSVISLNASKHSLVVICASVLTNAELVDIVFE